MERGIEKVRGKYHEGVARVGCILSWMKSRRSLHSDVQHDENRRDRERIEKGRAEVVRWMDAFRKSEKRADKYKFLVFFRQPGYGVLSCLYASHFKPLCIFSLLTGERDKESDFSIVHTKIFLENRSFLDSVSSIVK